MNNFFETHPEFWQQDSRRSRGWATVTAESLETRHRAALPQWLVQDARVLDLGSCLAASGGWVLDQGCAHYTGVETQAAMVQTSREILGRYWSEDRWTIEAADCRQFLARAHAQGHRWDVVILIGVIYAYLDTYGLLESVAQVCDHCLVLDSIYPWHMATPDVPMIDLVQAQHINSSDEGMAYKGMGARPSPRAADWIMSTLGFENKEGLIMPDPMQDRSVHDSYLTPIHRPGARAQCLTPTRWMSRYYRTGQPPARVVGDVVVSNQRGEQVSMATAPVVIESQPWVFDQAVAQRFQEEARCHIPDYQRVIELGAELVSGVMGSERKDLAIIDVGSALGHTMQYYIDRGYTDVWGVDNSEAMIASSQYPSRVYKRDRFPSGKSWDVVLANWTLHFIKEREQYLMDIYNNLKPGGILMISDKMEHSQEIEDLYYDFKRANGVPEAVIQAKKHNLAGVLTVMPLKWYIETLEKIGFSSVEVVNARFMFRTVYARKF